VGAAERGVGDVKTFQELSKSVNNSIAGKTVAWVPQVLEGMYLHQAWTYGIKYDAKRLGIKLLIRDPNWNSAAQAQAIASLIPQKPDVILVQNANATLNAKLLKEAEENGIYVISVNMHSNYISSGFVGVDYYEEGKMIAEEICKYATSEGRSGKIAIIGGDSTATASMDTIAGGMEVFKKNPKVKVVSTQMANWLAPKAHELATSIIQQNPDISVFWGMYDHSDVGIAQAVKEAGKVGKIAVFTSGGGEGLMCGKVKNGEFTKYWTWNAVQQGQDIMRLAQFLLQSGIKPGSKKFTLFTDVREITKDNADHMCWPIPKDPNQGYYPEPSIK
jgi:ribose transport system substrate-binding protein